MAKYIMKFTKEGYLKYISHLDILRLFKRSFKKTDIDLMHSHGFNPHPKMGFAQPLSLGYSSICEIIEFETRENFEPEFIREKISNVMPQGIAILFCKGIEDRGKPLAALVEAADYNIKIPITPIEQKELREHGMAKMTEFLAQTDIIVQKSQKKTNKLLYVDIKKMIRDLDFKIFEGFLNIHCKVDCGSNSNLSPELVIVALAGFLKLEALREDMDITRTKIDFVNNLQL